MLKINIYINLSLIFLNILTLYVYCLRVTHKRIIFIIDTRQAAKMLFSS